MPSKSAGRPKALSWQPLPEFLQATGANSSQRHLGQLLKAIAEVNSENRTYTTYSGIAGKLMDRPEYEHLGDRQLRRDVAKAIKWVIGNLKRIPPNLWVKILGIAPPPTMTDRHLREMAFAFLRHYLAQR